MSVLSPSDLEPSLFDQLGSWHSPSNAHAYRLLIFKEQQQAVACCVALTNSLSAQKRNYELLLKPCQAV
jgi:hypothetical protein